MKEVYVVLVRHFTFNRDSRGFTKRDIKRYRKMLCELSSSSSSRVVEVFSSRELAEQKARDFINDDYYSYHYFPVTDSDGNVLRSTLTIYDYYIEETYLVDKL